MGKWQNLTAKQKAQVIKFAIQNGVSDIKTIRDTYNLYSNGGQEEILNKVNSSNANFVQRLKDPNRKNIPDWESPTDRISTHKLSVGTDENGNHYIFPEVQEINGELIDFTRPPYHRFAGEMSAEMRGDTVRVPSLDDAIKFTKTYKQYYPFSTGGPLYPFSFEKNPFLKTPVVRYDQGGELDSWEQEALSRANRVYSNYEQAVDNKIPLWRIPLQKQLKNLGLPSGLSNCTLSATQWVDPNNPIMSAATIFNSPSSGYTKINSKDAVPGNLLITKNPETGGYHTMMIEGFTDSGEPILRYSNGDHTQDALRTNITLSEYHRRDNNQGGNHTEDYYFRYNYPNEVFLPEVTVWAQKGHKKSGKEQEETQSLDTRKVDIDAWYAGNNNRKRGVNTEELKQFQDSLVANNIPLAQRLAILGTSAQETGTEGSASYGIGGMGLLGLSGQRMDSALVSHNPDTVGMQIHFLIQDLKKRHSDNWLEGGAGGPTIKTGKEGFEKFWGGNNVDTITQVLNKSYIRPAERLNAWKNRAEVAKSMLKYLK